MNHWLRICRHSNPMLATKFAVYFWHDIPLIMFSITSFKFSLLYPLCTVIFRCFIPPTRKFYIVTVCPIFWICRREYWAGPQQQLYFDGSQVKIGGMYTFSCQIKLRNKTPKPQTFRIRIASTLQSELLLYLLFQLCASQRSEQKFSPVVFGIAEVLLALKTLCIAIANIPKILRHHSAQCEIHKSLQVMSFQLQCSKVFAFSWFFPFHTRYFRKMREAECCQQLFCLILF